MLLELAPQGCLAVEAEGRVVSTTTLLPYRSRLAWIGMVLTHPEFRRRGLARALLAQAIEQSDRHGIATVKLDATEEGRPLYESLGFRSEQAVERWYRKGEPTGENQVHGNLSPRALAADAEANGFDRSHVLPALAARSRVLEDEDGFVLARPGRFASYLGPCIAKDAATLERLICAALDRDLETAWAWDLLPANAPAVELARKLGFSPVRRLTRMVRGENFRGREEGIGAIAGFELG